MERKSTVAGTRGRQWDMSGSNLPDPSPLFPIGFMAPPEPGRKGRPPACLDVPLLRSLMAHLGLGVRAVQRLVVVWDGVKQRWIRPSVATLNRKLEEYAIERGRTWVQPPHATERETA